MFLDILIICFFFYGLYKGYITGFIGIIIKLLSNILSIFLSTIFVKSLYLYLNKNIKLNDYIYLKLNYLLPNLNLHFKNLQTDAIKVKLANIDIYNNFPKSFQNYIVQEITTNNKLHFDLNVILSQYIAYMICFLLLVFILKMIFMFLFTVINQFLNFSAFKLSNQLIGSICYSINYFIIGTFFGSLIYILSLLTNTSIGSSIILVFLFNCIKSLI
jgi:hypothetical protein